MVARVDTIGVCGSSCSQAHHRSRLVATVGLFTAVLKAHQCPGTQAEHHPRLRIKLTLQWQSLSCALERLHANVSMFPLAECNQPSASSRHKRPEISKCIRFVQLQNRLCDTKSSKCQLGQKRSKEASRIGGAMLTKHGEFLQEMSLQPQQGRCNKWRFGEIVVSINSCHRPSTQHLPAS